MKAWRCLVCGYVHEGDAPPDECPVCGAPVSDFEESVVASAKPSPLRWLCLDCGYVHEGPEPPAECPICGAPRDRFEPVVEGAAPAPAGMLRVVIVGAGVAGVSAAEAARRSSPEAEITIISREKELPYYRLNLTRYIAGEIGADELPIHPEQWYHDQRITLLRGRKAVRVCAEDRAVELDDGVRLPYDRLVLAMGANPFMPPIKGADLPGVTALRSRQDAEAILAAISPGAPCVCIGGGILGLETAGAIARRGARVTLLEAFPYLMPRQLNRRAGDKLAAFVARLGIELRCGVKVEAIVGDDRVSGVRLADGTTIPASLVVIAAGVRPETSLAKDLDIPVKGGILVDDLLAAHPDVFAVGDAAEHRGVLYGLWGPALYQGGIAGKNASGVKATFGGIPRSNTLKVLGMELFSIGTFEPEGEGHAILEEEAEDKYLRLVFKDGCLVGAILLGDASAAAKVKKAIETGMSFAAHLADRPSASGIIGGLTA